MSRPLPLGVIEQIEHFPSLGFNHVIVLFEGQPVFLEIFTAVDLNELLLVTGLVVSALLVGARLAVELLSVTS